MFLYSRYNISAMAHKIMALFTFTLMIVSLSMLLTTNTKISEAEVAHVRENYSQYIAQFGPVGKK